MGKKLNIVEKIIKEESKRQRRKSEIRLAAAGCLPREIVALAPHRKERERNKKSDFQRVEEGNIRLF